MRIEVSRRELILWLFLVTAASSAMGAVVEIASEFHDTYGWLVLFDLDLLRGRARPVLLFSR